MYDYSYYRYLAKDSEIKIRVPKQFKEDIKEETKVVDTTMTDYVMKAICQQDNDKTIRSLEKRIKKLEEENERYKCTINGITTAYNMICADFSEGIEDLGKELQRWYLK